MNRNGQFLMQAYLPTFLVDALDADARKMVPPVSRGEFLAGLLSQRYPRVKRR